MKVLFVEPPKDRWFVMGEYLPPPYGILQLAAFLEGEVKDVEIKVLDCQAERLDWKGLGREIESFGPDVVAPSGLATCNAYAVVRTLEAAKEANPDVLAVAGGQHFTATARESLETYPEIDVIVRGEGELTLADLVRARSEKRPLSEVDGISFRSGGGVRNNPDRRQIESLDSLPFPGYHFVEHLVGEYHFSTMAGRKAGYALIEGSRGCQHRCTFCSQWRHWQGSWRAKTPKRVADEIEFCYSNYGSRFVWLTDDNFGFGKRAGELADEILDRGIAGDLMWFVQARCDDVVRHQDLLPKLRRSGLSWVLLGVESDRERALDSYRKGIGPEDARLAVKLLKENGIFAHAMFIIGGREDSAESISGLREFVNQLDPDLAIFGILTPFPGTEVYEEASKRGWIEDTNWADYDMVHAIMPTESLSREEVQQELYGCYRSFYGSLGRRFGGLFAKNEMRRRVYWHMATRGIAKRLRRF
ncbi:MAG: cobalamin-dependent protein [Candidatus Brockarchaeota archaeon]|nr:cobalamin-dependent protein [Candidatus Brockarchaeota archaeon]